MFSCDEAAMKQQPPRVWAQNGWDEQSLSEKDLSYYPPSWSHVQVLTSKQRKVLSLHGSHAKSTPIEVVCQGCAEKEDES